jgi:hypothetical protein
MPCRSCSRHVPLTLNGVCDYFHVEHTYASEVMSRDGLNVFEEARKDELMCNIVPCYTSVCCSCYRTHLLFQPTSIRKDNTYEIIRLVAYKRQLEVDYYLPFSCD